MSASVEERAVLILDKAIERIKDTGFDIRSYTNDKCCYIGNVLRVVNVQYRALVGPLHYTRTLDGSVNCALGALDAVGRRRLKEAEVEEPLYALYPGRIVEHYGLGIHHVAENSAQETVEALSVFTEARDNLQRVIDSQLFEAIRLPERNVDRDSELALVH